MRPNRLTLSWESLAVSIVALLVTQQAEWMWHLAGLGPVAMPYSGVTQATLLGYLLGGLLQVVPHELGHLLAAFALRLPVLGMAVGPFHLGSRPVQGTAGHVAVDLSAVDLGAVDLGASDRRVPLRLTVLALAGPVGGLVAAGLALLVARDPALAPSVRVGLASAAVTAAIVQLANLIPERISAALPNDGAQALRWIIHPNEELGRLRLGRDLGAVADAGRRAAIARVQTDDLARLRAAVDDPRPAVAHSAMIALLRFQEASSPENPANADGRGESLESYRRQRRDEVELMLRYVERVEQPSGLRATAANRTAMSLLSALAEKTEDERRASGELPKLVRLAELAQRLEPEWPPAQQTFALARQLQGGLLEGRAPDARE